MRQVQEQEALLVAVQAAQRRLHPVLPQLHMQPLSALHPFSWTSRLGIGEPSQSMQGMGHALLPALHRDQASKALPLLCCAEACEEESLSKFTCAVPEEG